MPLVTDAKMEEPHVSPNNLRLEEKMLKVLWFVPFEISLDIFLFVLFVHCVYEKVSAFILRLSCDTETKNL